MAGLADKTTPEVAPPSPNGGNGVAPAPGQSLPPAPDDASRLCPNCAALMAEGQDWCLECGTAQPGRLGGRPGWRAALTVVAITAVLAAGAVAAAYAALSSDAERQASAPPPPPAAPVVPEPPAAPPPPAAEEPTPEIPAPGDAGGGDASAPKAAEPEPEPVAPPSDPDPAPPVDPGPTDDGGSEDTGGDDGADDKPAKPKPKLVALAPDAASTYDPLGRGANLTGDPAEAIDGEMKTHWEAPVGTDGRVDIGLLISLEHLTKMDKLRLRAGTPGFNVELYGATTTKVPEGDVLNPQWKQLDRTRDFGTDEKLDVKGRYRHVLLWFTEQPADTKVMIPEVELLK
jgi:hypothetical protein